MLYNDGLLIYINVHLYFVRKFAQHYRHYHYSIDLETYTNESLHYNAIR